MAKNEPTTPEQQLLKLIEGKGGAPPAKGGSASGGKPKGRGLSIPFKKLPGLFMGSLSFWKRRTKKRSHGRPFVLGIAEVNKALVAATALLFVYVIFDAAASARSLHAPPNFAPMKEAKAKAPKETVAPLEETSYYLQKVGSRDIFREGKKAPEPVAETSSTETVVQDSEAVQNLALVGISWSSNPDAIVEDKSKQRTYFVKRGQEVGDGVRVEAIFKDHVVVTFEDREYELR